MWRSCGDDEAKRRGARVSAGAIGGEDKVEVSTRGVVEGGIGGVTFERAMMMMNDRYR